ncbi:MAG: transketolase, partial [Chloroflexota bacterium]
NGYRIKEKLPENLGEITLPLGVPEILREGTDISVVTYGPLCRIAVESAKLLQDVGISIEVIDVQSLLPFDVHQKIIDSLKKTNRVIFLDEDVPGGTSAYMMQQVIEKQGGYYWLDSEPRTLPAQEHRPAYGTDGNNWSKPNVENIFETAYEMMHEVDPSTYPMFFK